MGQRTSGTNRLRPMHLHSLNRFDTNFILHVIVNSCQFQYIAAYFHMSKRLDENHEEQRRV